MAGLYTVYCHTVCHVVVGGLCVLGLHKFIINNNDGH